MTKAKTKAKAKKEEEQVAKIPPINIKVAKLTLVGSSPLIVNNFDEKTRQQLDDAQQGKAKQKKAPRNPQAEYQAAFYRMPGHTEKKPKYGMPASGLKKCAVSACRYVDLKMTEVKGAFHVMEDANSLVQIKSKKGPVMHSAIVRVGGFGAKKPMTRYRPVWNDWEVTFSIEYNANVITPEQLANLYENAGFSVGLCEWRVEKDGSNGRFKVKRAA